MGLFDKFKKNQQPKTDSEAIEREMYENNTLGYRDLKDHLDYQQELINKVNLANAQYEKDGDMDALIKVYEMAFYEADPPCASSQNLKLVDYYLKSNSNDKAWEYLNFLYLGSYAPKEKIRFLQAKILKKEKKYLDAIDMYMMGYLLKSEWNNEFQREMFIKDVKVCTNKLSWDDDKLEALADLVQEQVNQRNYDESTLSKAYKNMFP